MREEASLTAPALELLEWGQQARERSGVGVPGDDSGLARLAVLQDGRCRRQRLWSWHRYWIETAGTGEASQVRCGTIADIKVNKPGKSR